MTTAHSNDVIVYKIMKSKGNLSLTTALSFPLVFTIIIISYSLVLCTRVVCNYVVLFYAYCRLMRQREKVY